MTPTTGARRTVTLLMEAPTVPPEGALLVRIPVLGAASFATLPAVPAPHRVTVSLGDPGLRRFVPAGFEALGYRLVGSHGALSSPSDEALLLLRAPLLDGQPDWTREVLGRALRVFSCDLGPVQLLFREHLARHLLVEG